VSPNQWNDELLAIIVQLYLRSDDAAYAAKKLREGLKHRLVGGLDDLVADCINKQNWDLLIETWLSFSASRAAVDSSDDLVDRRKIRHLAKLASVDDIGGRYLLLAKYLATDDVSSKYTDRKSKDALENLKHKLSRAAIKQPCPPEQASVILKSRNDHGLYYEYFRRILPRQKDKKMRSPAHTLHLTEIYKEYRQMPEAKPSKQLLHGVFNLAFPSDVPTLMALYQDWKKFMGEFDQMAYMRFLTFFAKLGDVKAVQDLWKQFVTDYPRALQRPSAFNSIVNVYAQVGDFESAEKELKVMQDQYGLTPCLDTMNMVLKSYVKAGNYQGAMDCYERIQKTYKPDSYTFAHVMAISAKRGDVENTLDLFKRSQKSDASPTKEMALALVLAYCRNDKLAEAERICIQLAERKVTSVAVWNLLINHNGMQGNLPSCYRLLQLMKRYGLQWNDQTHEFLFQALAKADQLQAAHNLLRRAQKSKLFMVTPEHYAIVMTAAVRLGDFAAVESMAAQMQQAGHTMNFNAHVAYMRAYISQTPEPARLKVLIRVLVDHVKAMVPKLEEPITDRIDNALVEPDHLDTAYLDMEHTDIDLTEADMAESDGKVTASVSIGDPRVLGVQTQQFAQAILLLTELKDYDTLDELIDLHSTIFPATKNLGSLPPSVASAIMAAYYKRNQLKRVLDLWRQVWDDTLSRAKDAKGNIYPAYQFSLNRPLHLVIFSYRRQNNGMGLLHCIRQVTSTGFKLTTSNWEMAIRYLAEMGQWERAVEWCESILMPLWAGWRQRKPALEARWKLKNAHAIKPPSEAVIETLHHEWLEMQKLAAWSPEVSTKLKGFSTQFPKLHHAMLTAASKKMLNSVETSTRQSLKKAIDKMISVYSLDELKTLKRILGDDLQSTLSKAARYRRIAAMRARAASTGVDPSTIPKHGRERALSLYYTIKSRVENQQKAGKTNPKLELTQDATASETTTGGDTSTSLPVSEDAKANSFTPANKSGADITRAASTDTAASERERPHAPDATVLGADSPSSTNTTMIRNNRPPIRLRSAYLRRRQIPGEGVRTATPLSATAGGSGS
jgi:pentatricopeptide repeat-containing protein PET309